VKRQEEAHSRAEPLAWSAAGHLYGIDPHCLENSRGVSSRVQSSQMLEPDEPEAISQSSPRDRDRSGDLTLPFPSRRNGCTISPTAPYCGKLRCASIAVVERAGSLLQSSECFGRCRSDEFQVMKLREGLDADRER